MIAAVALLALVAAPRWTYEVTASGTTLAVKATFPPGSGEDFEVDGTEESVSEVRFGGRTVPPTGCWCTSWSHASIPSLNRYGHRWAEEGLATYVEPIVRARAGLISDGQFWSGLVEGLPQGLPHAGDRGLDATPTWGRTYWGGALFWLLADVQIRERTRGKHSLGDALRAVLAKSGGMATHWPLARVLGEGDSAVVVPVLEELHEQMGARPVPVDLDALFRRLGVPTSGSKTPFDDSAPLARVRAAITASP
jgi:hypothetical protein